MKSEPKLSSVEQQLLSLIKLKNRQYKITCSYTRVIIALSCLFLEHFFASCRWIETVVLWKIILKEGLIVRRWPKRLSKPRETRGNDFYLPLIFFARIPAPLGIVPTCLARHLFALHLPCGATRNEIAYETKPDHYFMAIYVEIYFKKFILRTLDEFTKHISSKKYILIMLYVM